MSDSHKGVVLIIDDEAPKCVTLLKELTQAGYLAHEALSASGGLHYLNSRSVDVVISDFRLPEMDGLEFLDRVKAQSPRTHVILMTANGRVDSAVEAMRRGACDYLIKPISAALLLGRIDALDHSFSQTAKSGAVDGNSGASGDGAEFQSGVSKAAVFGNAPSSMAQRLDGWPVVETVAGLTETIAGVERSLIAAALRRAAGNQAKAAQFLRIPRTTLRDKMTKYGMVGETGKSKLAESSETS